MKIGLTYDLRPVEPQSPDLPVDHYAEFDSSETLFFLTEGLQALGFQVELIGNLSALLEQLHSNLLTVDLIFNIAEGLWGRGREALIPALLEAYRIPYVGSDPLTLSLCLDKAMTKQVWRGCGLPTASAWVVRRIEELSHLEIAAHDYPLFVKPCHEGSSKGIDSQRSVNSSFLELCSQVEYLLKLYQQPILIEKFLPGREFTVGILGTGQDARVLGITEITEVALYGASGYREKEEWESLAPDTYLPLGPSSLWDELANIALAAYQAVECRDLGRVDIRLDAAGNPNLLEINPLPGLNPKHCALPVIAKQQGLLYQDLLGHILESCLRRYK
ncbi:MAG: D-alanine--D-alanine ligase [Cyanobacteriota bacterium]